MNERIKELSLKAAYAVDLEDPKFFQKYSEKFAKLIVKECAALDFYKLAHIGTEDDYRVTQVIKEHFGV